MISPGIIYALAGVALFVIGLHALIAQAEILRRILAVNVCGSGVFTILVALAHTAEGAAPDPVPHAMVITGIVVAIAATALALALMLRLRALDRDTPPPAEREQPRR